MDRRSRYLVCLCNGLWINSSEFGSVLDEDKKLVTIANFTLNDEAGRDQEGIETKFYSLPKHGVIVTAFVFSLETSRGDRMRSDRMKGEKDIFSFFLVLPYSEISEYLARYTFCQEKVEKLLDDHFLLYMKKMVSGAVWI